MDKYSEIMILYFKVHSHFVKYNMCHFCSNNYMYSHGGNVSGSQRFQLFYFEE